MIIFLLILRNNSWENIFPSSESFLRLNVKFDLDGRNSSTISVSQLDMETCSRHIIKVTFVGSNGQDCGACSVIKVKGRRQYPFNMSKFINDVKGTPSPPPSSTITPPSIITTTPPPPTMTTTTTITTAAEVETTTPPSTPRT